MAVVEFKTENKGVSGGPSFPTLVLERKGDVARIAALENPHAGFVHTIKSPVLLNGLPKMETITRRDNTTFQDFAKDFVSRPFCLGDEGVVAERGMDPDHCPVCRAAKDFPEWFAKPDRRFAMHVLVYNTNPGTTSLTSPFNVTVKVWTFADKVFSSLVDLIKEFGGNARDFDLKLTCSNPMYRTYEIQGLPTAEWRSDESRTRIAIDTFKGQRAADIEELIGRKSPTATVQDDVDLTVKKWKSALRASGTPVDSGPAVDLTQQHQNGGQTQNGNPAAPPPPVDFDSLLGSPGTPLPPLPAGPAPTNDFYIASLLDNPAAPPPTAPPAAPPSDPWAAVPTTPPPSDLWSTPPAAAPAAVAAPASSPAIDLASLLVQSAPAAAPAAPPPASLLVQSAPAAAPAAPPPAVPPPAATQTIEELLADLDF